MIILTAANSDKARNDQGKIYKKFSFKGVITATTEKAKEFGYRAVVHNLGSLGMGEPFEVSNESFSEKGYYEKEVKKGYKSKSLFKPKMIRLCMEKYNDFVAYLDGDAQLCGRIDEVMTGDYDIGVTLRDREELESDWHREHMEIVKYVNAGVVFCCPTEAARKFLVSWEKTTEDVGNDQMALNKLACPDFYPTVYSILELNGVRIKYFPCNVYNYYYFNEYWSPDSKILHFKADVRGFYPFDNKKRMFSMFIVPILKKVRMLFGMGKKRWSRKFWQDDK
ncbi:MAG: putative nucleotide-diphospho-sugar transferase [Thermodesulfobacteriota bacterium]